VAKKYFLSIFKTDRHWKKASGFKNLISVFLWILVFSKR